MHHREPGIQNQSRSQLESQSPLAALFQQTRSATVRLASPLSPEDCALQPMPDASPVKWHLAHTSWFFETFILERFEPGYTHFDASFRILFNSYYNAVGEKHPRPQRGMISRPGLAEVLSYRKHVDEHMLALLAKSPVPPELADLVTLGVNHEEQHQELILTDLKYLLSLNPLKPVYQKHWPLTPIMARKPAWVKFQGGVVEAGFAEKEFAFDNESPRHKTYVHPFELASLPVTHGEFLAFMEDGGYRKPDLWLSLGWDAVNAQKWEAPLYWEKRNGVWHTFTLHGMAPVDPNTPLCHISYFEADAFARWAGARLPTEFEWELASQDVEIAGNFVDTGALHPLALRDEPPVSGLAQMFGDVWEWTQSSYAPYPGFKAAAGAIGEYNGKFMCNQYVLRGGSCATPLRHIRPTYRNFFPPDARWQFSGLRLARDVS
jgi:ergothioneine biosynthesis protein EgtB